MRALITALIKIWREQDIQIVPGATDSDILQFETEYNVALPPLVKMYFTSVNGMGPIGAQFDDEFFNFWALHDVTRVDARFSKSQLHDYFLFADHSIGLVYYAMRLGQFQDSTGEVIAIYPPYEHDEVPFLRFENFEAFIRAYLNGPMRHCL